MTRRLCGMLAGVLLLTCASLSIPHSSAIAQECGELSERTCGFLAAAITTWNTRLSSNVRIEQCHYDRQEVANVDSLLSILDRESEWRVPSMDSEGNISIVQLSSELRSQWRRAEIGHLRQLLGGNSGTAHFVRLVWRSRSGEEFLSTVIGSNTPPYLHGRILSSIVLESESNSCLYKRLMWLWGSTRGEIAAELELEPISQNNKLDCKKTDSAWMALGDAYVKMREIEYMDGGCRSAYAWAYATPMATISFNADLFSFTVSGLGSKGMGSGDCIAPRR